MGKRYTKEVQREALKLADEIGPAAAARRLGINTDTLYGWRSQEKERTAALEAAVGGRSEAELLAESKALREQLKQARSALSAKSGEAEEAARSAGTLARELEQQPDVLIAAHPIRGLDIGAAAFVHEYLVQAKHRGCAVLLISADLAEILQLADRSAVCYEGRILGVFDGKDPPVEEISLAMAGRSVQNSPAGCVQNLY